MKKMTKKKKKKKHDMRLMKTKLTKLMLKTQQHLPTPPDTRIWKSKKKYHQKIQVRGWGEHDVTFETSDYG